MPLNRNNPQDKERTAFTEWHKVSEFEDGSFWMSAQQYNCWGDKIRGLSWQRIAAETAKNLIGLVDHRTLERMQDGCCPPQLMKEFIEAERYAAESEDATEEKIALHAKGYIGGAS